TGDAAFDQVGRRALVDSDLAHELRRQQREADAAAHRLELIEDEPVAGGYAVAVDQRLRQARAGAADADAVVLVEAALAAGGRTGIHAGDALDRVGDIFVGHLADVFGGDDFDDRVGVALGGQRLLARCANAGDDDGLELGGGLGGAGGFGRRSRRRLLGKRVGADQGERHSRCDRGQSQLHWQVLGYNMTSTVPMYYQLLF